MAKLKEIQSWTKQIDDGNVRNIFSEIKENFKTNKEDSSALHLLIHLSKYVKKENIAEHNDIIFNLSVLCSEVVQNVDDLSANKKPFLISVYHIINYFVNQGEIDHALILLDFIVNAARKSHETEHDQDLLNVYTSCYCLLSNFATGLMNAYNEDKTVGKCTLWLKVLKSGFECYLYSKSNACWKQALYVFGKLTTIHKDHSHIADKFRNDIFDIFTNLITEKHFVGFEMYTFFHEFCLRLPGILKSSIRCEAVSISRLITFCKSALENDRKLSSCLSLLHSAVITIMFYKPGQSEDFFLQLEKCREDFDTLVSTCENEKCLSDLAVCLLSVFVDVAIEWRQFTSEKWSQMFSIKIQSSLYNLLLNMCGYLCPDEEFVCDKIKSDLVILVLCAYRSVINCVYKSASHEISGYELLFVQALVVIRDCEKLISFLKLNKNQNWQSSWSALSAPMFNFGWLCHSREQYQQSLDFSSAFCQLFFKLEDRYEEPVCFKDALNKGLNILVSSYHRLKKFKGALTAVTMGLVALPQSKKYFFEKWVDIKCSATDVHNIQTLTVKDIISSSKFTKILPQIDINEYEFLVEELEAYQTARYLMSASIETTSTLLFSLSASKTSLDPCLFSRIVIVYVKYLWMLEDFSQCDKAIELCEESIAALEDEIDDSYGLEKQRSLLILSQLYYCLFLHQFKKTHCNEKAEVEAVSIPTKQGATVLSGGSDPHDACDEVPAYINLTVAKEQKILQPLKLAQKCWCKVLNEGFIEVNNEYIEKSLSCMEEVSYIYALYGFDTHRAQVWFLYYRIAEHTSNKAGCLKALTNLLQLLGDTVGKDWLTQMEDLVVELKLEDKTDSNSKNLLQWYWLTRSWNCFFKSEFTEGVKYLKLLKQQVCSNNYMIYAWTKWLTAHYLLLTPLVVTPEDLNELGVLHVINVTYNTSISLVKSLSFSASPKLYYMTLYTLMEISLWRGEINLWLRWPREARCYLKEDLIHAQKLSLPTRTAQFLSTLAQVDLLCGNVEDSEIKAYGIKYILEISDSNSVFTPRKKENRNELDSIKDQLQDLDLDGDIVTEMIMDCTEDSKRYPTPTGSPVLHRPSFTFPSFVRHLPSCECAVCENVICQNLFMHLALIEAVFNWYKSDTKLAGSFFGGGFVLKDQILKKHKAYYQRFIPNYTSDSKLILPDLVHRSLSSTVIKFLFYYADFMGSKNQFKKALSFNELAEFELKYVLIPDFSLEAMQQKYSIIEAMILDQKENYHMVEVADDYEKDVSQISPMKCNTVYATPIIHKSSHTVNVPKKLDLESKSPASLSPLPYMKQKFPVFHLSPPSGGGNSDVETKTQNVSSETPCRKLFSSNCSSADNCTGSSFTSTEVLEDDVFLSPTAPTSPLKKEFHFQTIESSGCKKGRRIKSEKDCKENYSAKQNTRCRRVLSEKATEKNKKADITTEDLINVVKTKLALDQSPSNSSQESCGSSNNYYDSENMQKSVKTKRNMQHKAENKTDYFSPVYIDNTKINSKNSKKGPKMDSGKQVLATKVKKDDVFEVPDIGNTAVVRSLRTRKKVSESEKEKENSNMFDIYIDPTPTKSRGRKKVNIEAERLDIAAGGRTETKSTPRLTRKKKSEKNPFIYM